MPTITFTHSEVTAALPKANGVVGGPEAWELYCSMEGAENAAATVRTKLYSIFTDRMNPVTYDSIEKLIWRVQDEIGEDLKFNHGNTYGWFDTEPRWQLTRFIHKLFDTDYD